MTTLKALTLIAPLAAGLVFGSPSAGAAAFRYSYSFGNGDSISGTFDGSAAGAFVTNLSNISLSINGNPTGPVNTLSYWAVIGTRGEPFQVSFDSALNNFWFASPDVLDGLGNVIADGSYGFALLGAGVTSSLALTYGNNRAFEVDASHAIPARQFTMNGSWSLVEIPEPGTLALVGIAFAGLRYRRTRIN